MSYTYINSTRSSARQATDKGEGLTGGILFLKKHRSLFKNGKFSSKLPNHTDKCQSKAC